MLYIALKKSCYALKKSKSEQKENTVAQSFAHTIRG